jgi:4,5-DOPA dioxygenase extradiol
MKLKDFNNIMIPSESTSSMPLLFVGHGSPMNAIEENSFSRTWKDLGKTLPNPSAILCISAHWETRGTFVTSVEKPPTIHDFYGFPDALFDLQYPAPGSPQLADKVRHLSTSLKVGGDSAWGLDHGCWSVLKHVYPLADIPVVQLSLDHTMKPGDHYLLAKELKDLRKKGVLIMGSGNIVHNLRLIDWKHPGGGHTWAVEANDELKRLIVTGDYLKLINYDLLGEAIRLSIPSPEHFLPLLYILALADETETLSFFNDSCVYGSLAMTSIIIQS